VIQAESGKISAGDRLVLNDLLPAIEGMSLSANDEKGNSL
jgi:hypothetical protein